MDCAIEFLNPTSQCLNSVSCSMAVIPSGISHIGALTKVQTPTNLRDSLRYPTLSSTLPAGLRSHGFTILDFPPGSVLEIGLAEFAAELSFPSIALGITLELRPSLVLFEVRHYAFLKTPYPLLHISILFRCRCALYSENPLSQVFSPFSSALLIQLPSLNRVLVD